MKFVSYVVLAVLVSGPAFAQKKQAPPARRAQPAAHPQAAPAPIAAPAAREPQQQQDHRAEDRSQNYNDRSPGGKFAQGFRIGLAYGPRTAKIDFFGSVSVDVDSSYGIEFAYIDMPVGRLGWTAAFAAFEPKTKTGSNKLYRISGNAGYAFTENIAISGGLNFARLSDEANGTKQSFNIGAQLGLAFQFTKNIGADLRYAQYKTKLEAPLTSGGNTIGQIAINMEISGPEAVVHWTF